MVVNSRDFSEPTVDKEPPLHLLHGCQPSSCPDTTCTRPLTILGDKIRPRGTSEPPHLLSYYLGRCIPSLAVRTAVEDSSSSRSFRVLTKSHIVGAVGCYILCHVTLVCLMSPTCFRITSFVLITRHGFHLLHLDQVSSGPRVLLQSVQPHFPTSRSSSLTIFFSQGTHFWGPVSPSQPPKFLLSSIYFSRWPTSVSPWLLSQI